MPKFDDDQSFFEKQMKGVKPLKSISKKIQIKPPSSRSNKKILLEPIKKEQFPFSDYIAEQITADTQLCFSKPGLQHKMLHFLRTGRIAYQAKLDLHGKTVEQARTALSDFLAHCKGQKYRSILIIHGKGKPGGVPPILKNHLNSWLQQYPDILAFCSALPSDGGTGALYILLKKSIVD